MESTNNTPPFQTPEEDKTSWAIVPWKPQTSSSSSSGQENNWKIIPWKKKEGTSKSSALSDADFFAEEALKIALWAGVFISSLFSAPTFLLSGFIGLTIPPEVAHKLFKEVIKVWDQLPTEGKAIAGCGAVATSVILQIPVLPGVGGFYGGYRLRQYVDTLG